jgi:YesN/AraC family two-component response regulator
MERVILCVDDEEPILRSLERTLKLEGYRVLTACDAVKALSMLESEQADVVISDQRMPGMSGSEFLKVVRQKYPDTVRIMISGYSDFNELMKAINEGEIYRFISKPWDDKEFKAIIKQALSQKDAAGLVSRLMQEICRSANLAQNLAVDIGDDHTIIKLKLADCGKDLSAEGIFEVINHLFERIGLKDESKIRTISGAITRQAGKIMLTVDMKDGVSLQIELPNL